MLILLTGANGFVGKAVLNEAIVRGFKIRPVYRSRDIADEYFQSVFIPSLEDDFDWSSALKDVDVVIHTAGLTHVDHDSLIDPAEKFRKINVHGTMNLARQAAASGVKRFIFISSIKVNGERTSIGRPFAADDVPSPMDLYALSKAEAEFQLIQLSNETSLEITIIRPPLIYGSGVKGNFAKIVNLVRLGLPLPLGYITTNRRSMVSLDNLVDLILLSVTHPNASNQIFLISDGQDLSTSEIFHEIGCAIDCPVRLFKIPPVLIYCLSFIFGRKDVSIRLLESLQVDITKTRQVLGWNPILNVREGLRKIKV